MIRTAIVVAVIALVSASLASADSLSYMGETPATGDSWSALSAPFTQTDGLWDYCYELTVSSNTANYVWAIAAPYQPSSTATFGNSASWSWTWDSEGLNGGPAMVAAKAGTVFGGTYRFEFKSAAAPAHQLYEGSGRLAGTAWSNPEPGTIGMAFLVLGMAGLLRKRRR